MKTTIRTAFFLFTFLPFYSTHAQLDIIEWVYEVGYNDQGVFTNIDTNRVSIEIEKDTLINGITVQKLDVPLYVDVHENHTGLEYIYEESGLVFIWDDRTKSFDTLYNYNLDAGDNWTVESEAIVTVDSVKMVTISGEEKKQLYVTYEDPFMVTSSYNSIITEGFGDHTFYFNYVRFESAPIGASYFDPSLALVKTEEGTIEDINDTSTVYEVIIDDCTPDINLIVVDSICDLTDYISLAKVEDFTEGSLKRVQYYDSTFISSDYVGIPFSHVVYDVDRYNTEDSLTFTYTFEDKCGEDFIYNHVIRVVPCVEIDCSLKDEERLMFSTIQDDTICGNYNSFTMFVAAEHQWENYFSPFLDSISGELVDVLIFGGGIGFELDLSESNENDLVTVDLRYKNHCGALEIVEKTFIIGDRNCALGDLTAENIGLDSLFNERICANSDPILIELNVNPNWVNSISGNGVEYVSGDYYFNPSLLEFGDSSLISVNFNGGNLTKAVYISCLIDGLKENEEISRPTIYPNPSKGSFKIGSEYNINSVVIYSALGEVILQQAYQSDELITGLNSGIYIIELRDKRSSFKKQLIVE